MKKAYLDKDNPVGKASIRVHSFNASSILPQKNKVIESMLNNFFCYFSKYIEFNFVKLEKDQYSLYQEKDFKEFKLAEENIIKSYLANRKIIFIDTINNDLSKKWIDFQVDLLTKGELVQRRDKDKTIFYRDMFGNAKNLFLVNPENIRIVSYDDFKFEDKNAYHILLTYKKEEYSFIEEEDPYIRKHGSYIIQTQNIRTYLNDFAKEIKENNKNFVCEYNTIYYNIVINKDIVRQTLYSLIIEDNLTNEKTKFSYTEDLSFFKIYNLKNSSQERGVKYCLNIKIFKDGKIDKSYITENDLKNETKYDLYKKVFSIYKSYYDRSENIDCVICYKNQFFIVASNKISALPDFEAQNYLKSIDAYLATPRKSSDPEKQNSEKEKKPSKKINRKSNIVKAVWGSYYDLKTFFINNKFCFLPSPAFSVGAPINLQNAPVGRYIISKDFTFNKYDAETLFENILFRDFGSQFLNNLKLPSTFFGVKLLNEYFAQIEREKNIDIMFDKI